VLWATQRQLLSMAVAPTGKGIEQPAELIRIGRPTFGFA
jgi:hypothetical protein